MTIFGLNLKIPILSFLGQSNSWNFLEFFLGKRLDVDNIIYSLFTRVAYCLQYHTNCNNIEISISISILQYHTILQYHIFSVHRGGILFTLYPALLIIKGMYVHTQGGKVFV